MAQRQEGVVRVFAVHRVVGPSAEEAAAIGPERVDEIEARLAQARRSARAAPTARAARSRSRADRAPASPRDAKNPPRAWQRSSSHMPASRSGGASELAHDEHRGRRRGRDA